MIEKSRIKAIALSSGFKLKEQPDGSMDLNPYVYDFARALLDKRWVSVSERLPSESGNYLVYRYNGKTNNWEVTIEYFCTQSEWFKPYRSINNITHWQPLPQPPGEAQDD